MAGKFEIYKDKRGEHRFRLKAGNGEIILASEGYKPYRVVRMVSVRFRRTHPMINGTREKSQRTVSSCSTSKP